MTDLTDNLADVIGKNVSQSPRGIAHAIIAALPGMVKPLEWWHEDGSTDDLCSNYRIWDAGRGDWMMVSYSGPAPTRHYVGPSRDEAISAANAHHRAAIMAALGVERRHGR